MDTGMTSQLSQISQKRKFMAPFISMGRLTPTKPKSSIQRQTCTNSNLRADHKNHKDTCHSRLPPKSPKRTLYKFKEPLQETLEGKFKGSVASNRKKRYLIPPNIIERNESQKSVHDEVYNASNVQLTDQKEQENEPNLAAIYPDLVKKYEHESGNMRRNTSPDASKSSCFYKQRKVKLAVLCSVLKMKNELQIIRERREKLQAKTRQDITAKTRQDITEEE